MTDIELDSGFVVSIRLMGPFVFDHIERKYTFPPPIMRSIALAGGDVEEWPYEPPPDAPDKDDEDYPLWARNKARDYQVMQSATALAREKAHFFMLEALTIKKCPRPVLFIWWINVLRWWAHVRGRSADAIPFGARYLRFIKEHVIASNADWRKIQESAIAKEVTLDGVLEAAEFFRRKLGRDATPQGDEVDAQGEGGT